MLLSIIVPVFKVEATLDACVRSILRQTDHLQCIGGWDWELILVDDGSPDDCPAICDRWAQDTAHISVIHKPNGGLSDARNQGVRAARGQFVTFVDSDDTLADGTLQAMMTIIGKNPECDILEYSIEIRNRQGCLSRQNLPDRQWTSARQYWLETKAWEHTYACNKIYRRNIFDNVVFPVGRIYEDVWFLPTVLRRNPNVITTSEGTYQYAFNEQGITATATSAHLLQLLCSQMRAAWIMRTTPFTHNAWNLYRGMACRMLDIMRMMGR